MIHKDGYWLMRDKRYKFDSPLARHIAVFCKRVGVETIIDIGCGNGAYTKFLRGVGFEVDGYDGNPHTMEITDGECGVHNFAETTYIRPRDLILCLEVAEHIPREKEAIFTENLFLSMSNYIILSWAVEGQGGLGHVNCRNNDYVIDLADSYGYKLMERDTEVLRQVAKIKWFKKSVMVFESA